MATAAGCDAGLAKRQTPAQPARTLEQRPLNELQFVGSHNSYKLAIEPEIMAQLVDASPRIAGSMEYWHEPLARQLELGLRVLELDLFYDPTRQLFDRDSAFPVLHVQTIDSASSCATLEICFEQILAWTAANPQHEPIMISFNAKDSRIDRPGFVVPEPFTEHAFRELDGLLQQIVGARLLLPGDIERSGAGDTWLQWPTLGAARGKFLLLLDESGRKREQYLAANPVPVMFANLPATDHRAAIMVLNDPTRQAAEICARSAEGYLVRTRADANTVEARMNATQRRDAAFASGAQFVSTDYYLPATHFGNDYQVVLPGGGAVRRNPASACAAR